MSDPATTPKQLTELEYEAMRGRLFALEALMTQTWVVVLKSTQKGLRERIIQDSLIELEDVMLSQHPVAQRVGVDCAEAILRGAQRTVTKMEAGG